MSGRNFQAWEVKSSDFPKGDVQEEMKFLLRYAILAPSGPNTQPWKFSIEGDRVSVCADLTRRLPFVDPSDRTLYQSVGCAIANLIVAGEHFGFKPKLDLFPKGQKSDLVAKVRFDEGGTPGHPDLFKAIPQRSTVKNKYHAREIGDEELDKLKNYVNLPGLRLDYAKDTRTKETLADLERRAHIIQLSDRAFRKDLGQWLRPNKSPAYDGMPLYTFGLPGPASTVFPALFKEFDLSGMVAAKDMGIIMSSSAMALVSSSSDDKLAWTLTGIALERLMLAATLDEVRLSFFSQPIGVHKLRKELGRIFGVLYPQILFSLGMSPAAKHTPRRQLEEFLA